MLRKTELCLSFVLDAMRLMVSGTDDEVVQQPRKCLQLCIDAIFVCGGRRALCYLPEQNEWFMLANKLFRPLHRSNPSQCRGKIYISSHYLNQLGMSGLMEFYVPANDAWGAFQVESSSFQNTAVLKEYLYTTKQTLAKIEIYRYNAENGCRNGLKGPPISLFDSCVVTDEKYIYLIGGKSKCFWRYILVNNIQI